MTDCSFIHFTTVNCYCNTFIFFRNNFSSHHFKNYVLPVIVLTGHPDVQSAASLFKQGVVDYLVKPSKADTLLDAVRRAIGEQAVFE